MYAFTKICLLQASYITTPGPDTFLTLDGLRPDTAYSVRVRAFNAVGGGPFGAPARLRTRPLPPAPPRMECVNANHNSLKVKWGDQSGNRGGHSPGALYKHSRVCWVVLTFSDPFQEAPRPPLPPTPPPPTSWRWRTPAASSSRCTTGPRSRTRSTNWARTRGTASACAPPTPPGRGRSQGCTSTPRPTPFRRR